MSRCSLSLISPVVFALLTASGRGQETGARAVASEQPFLPYSTQRLVTLDPGERFELTLATGAKRAIRLRSVTDHRDGPVGLLRSADVVVEIDGEPVELRCAPCTMPTEVAGVRVLADSTSGWGRLDKRVQLSVWDAAEPIVDTGSFGFPLRDYRLFSHGTQAYNEPVHLGLWDADPEGARFYHDYGFDLAGYEGVTAVVCCAAGTVLDVFPPAGPYAVAIEDARGLVWEYQHLDAVSPALEVGAGIAIGEDIGILGRKGGAGEFSHLHLGTYASVARFREHVEDRRHNLYPWLVAAHEAKFRQGLYAVARPHVMAFVGEPVRLDGSRSLAFDRTITAWRWELPDGTVRAEPAVEVSFAKPGVYVAALWVTSDRGERDVDCCSIRVFSKPVPEPHLATIFMTHAPAAGVAVGEPVRFRCWQQGGAKTRLTFDFGDGTIVRDQDSYAPLTHRYATPGIHVVTVSAIIDGLPITQRQKVIVKPGDR